MTDKNLTEIVVILDRSGSMQSLTSDTIGGFNNFVEQQKKGSGKALLTLVQFDDHYQIDYSGKDVNEVKPLDEETYVPRGMTALLDAVGKTVNEVGARLSATPEEKRPGQVIFLIITDGLENTSKEFEAQQVKEMVRHQIDKYCWNFVYLGGGDIESQQEQGRSFGISATNVVNYTPSQDGTEKLYTNVAGAITRRRHLQKQGEMFTSDAPILNDNEKGSLITE